MEKEKGCPFCKSTDTTVEDDGTSLSWVTCLGCCAEGPAGYLEEEAIELWNRAKR